MHDKLRAFLAALTDEEADEIGLWLDGEPDCASQMIEHIFETHPALQEREDRLREEWDKKHPEKAVAKCEA